MLATQPLQQTRDVTKFTKLLLHLGLIAKTLSSIHTGFFNLLQLELVVYLDRSVIRGAITLNKSVGAELELEKGKVLVNVAQLIANGVSSSLQGVCPSQ